MADAVLSILIECYPVALPTSNDPEAMRAFSQKVFTYFGEFPRPFQSRRGKSTAQPAPYPLRSFVARYLSDFHKEMGQQGWVRA